MKKLILIATIIAALGIIHVSTAAPTSTLVQSLFITGLKSTPTAGLTIDSNGLVATGTVSGGSGSSTTMFGTAGVSVTALSNGRQTSSLDTAYAATWTALETFSSSTVMVGSVAIGTSTLNGVLNVATATSILSVQPSGNIGVGTTSPAYLVDIQGNPASTGGIAALRVINTSSGSGNTQASLYVQNGSSFGQLFKTGTGYTSYKNISANDLGFYDSGGNISILNDSGNINFAAGGASAPQITFGTNGGITQTGAANSFSSTSIVGAASTTGNLAVGGSLGSAGTITQAGIPVNISTSTATFGVTMATSTGGTLAAQSTSTTAFCVPYGGTILAWRVLGNAVGTSSIDIWKAPKAIPTAANSVTGGTFPNLNGQQVSSSTNLSGWTSSFSAGDCFMANTTSTQSNERTVTVQLDYAKS